MTAEMRLVCETIASQHSGVCRLNRNIDRINAELRKRDKENQEFRDRLSRYEASDRNSGNSSTPPLKDIIRFEVIRRTKTLSLQTGILAVRMV